MPRLIRHRRFLADHYVLIDDDLAASEVAPEALVADARRRAEMLARESTGNSQNFTLIQNGSGVARRSDPHVHIICTGSRRRKGLVYLYIGLKNLVPGRIRGGTARSAR